MIFRFGTYELDGERFALRRAGQLVPTQPKVLRLLLLLASERHRALSDQELLRTLWPHEKVERASIKRAVMGARVALGDRSQAVIRTIRGHGYQFVAELTAEPPAPAPDRAAFIGRAGVLGELDDSLTRVFAGDGHAVLIFGEPGMGKTRILHELARRARARAAHVWFGRCMEFDGAPAFWPLEQIMREARLELGEQALGALLGAGVADIAEGLPALGLPEDAQSGAPQIGAARFRFFESLTHFFVNAARDRPVLLLLDDLSRADPSSVRFLRFLLDQLSGARVLVVGTARPHDHRDDGGRVRLVELSFASATRSIALAGLSPHEVAAFIAQRTGSAAPPAVQARLIEQTAGNPLFLEEILRGLRSHTPAAAELAWHALSEVTSGVGLRGAITRHIAALPDDCCALLVQAAVLGREFAIGFLSELSGQSAAAVHAHVTQACEAGVLRRGPLDLVRFNHALIRDALYERCAPFARAEQHARVAERLEARALGVLDDAQLAQLAEHSFLAAPAGHAERALAYARRAAERALQKLAYEEAALHLGRALQLLAFGPAQAAMRAALLLAEGEALALGAEPVRARTSLLAAVAIAREIGDRDVLTRAAGLLGRARESGTVDAARVTLLREVLAGLSAEDPRVPGLSAQLAKALSYTGEPGERAGLALSALTHVRSGSPSANQAETLVACHEALAAPDHGDERIAIAGMLRRLGERDGDARTLAYALIAEAQNAVERGQPLDPVIAALSALAERVRDPGVRWYTEIYRSTRAMIGGQFALAEQCAGSAHTLGRSIGEEMAYHGYCVQMTGILRLSGRVDEASELVSDMITRFPALAGWRSVGASLAAEAGQRERARATLDALMADDLALLRRDPYLLSALCPASELCLRVGDASAAGVLYAALAPYAALHGNVSFGAASYGPIALTLAQLATRVRDFSPAIAHAEQALREAERMASPTYAALAGLAYAYALLRQGAPAELGRARQLATRAYETAQRIGMHATGAQCAALLAALPAG